MILLLLCFPSAIRSQVAATETCPRGALGSAVVAPQDLRSQNGVLRVNLALRSFRDAQGYFRYCYVDAEGHQAPTLRLQPGDLLILQLTNELSFVPQLTSAQETSSPDACVGSPMTIASTNLHFHGLSIPPKCHQDETIKTLIQPGDPPFEYRLQIPRTQPPGLYWYHPHPHGYSEAQVLGGASGALIIEGIERVNPLVAALPEQVFIIRDQPAPNSTPDPNKPGKDLSINFVLVPYPSYLPALIMMKPAERQFWRVLNASADTYLDLRLLFNGKPQQVGVVALDGVPLSYGDGGAQNRLLWESHLALPPAARAEFIVNGPPTGIQASLVTQRVETGPVYDADSPRPTSSTTSTVGQGDDDNTPPRPLATILTSTTASEPSFVVPASSVPIEERSLPPLARVTSVRQRTLYFSEKSQDPNDPTSPTLFYITEAGQTPTLFNPASPIPTLTVRQGEVEDWVIENRTQETHTFHIHQTHFLILARHGVPVEEPYLRDTVNVPYWDGFTPQYPSIKLRLDFRDPNLVGTFPYHCHILQHEDGGMMGTIRVEPALPVLEH